MPGERRRWASCRSSATNRHHPHSSHDVFPALPRAVRKTSTAQFWSHSTLRLQEPSHCHRTWGCSFQQEAKTAQAAAAHAEAMAVKAAEAQLRRHQSAAVQQQGEGGDKPASVEATFEQETKVRDELAKQLSQISQKYSGYCQREMAVQARMVERETKMQENNVNQEKVTEEMNRLKKSRREDLAG